MMAEKKQQPVSVPTALADFVRLGQFENAFITDESGLPLVTAGSTMSTSENQAALLSRIKNIIGMVDEQRGLGSVDEIVFNVAGKKKIACRNFIINQKRLILAITMASDQSYRRMTSTFIRQLQSFWKL